jgi:DNA-binding CsgD family transcriptional regulator
MPPRAKPPHPGNPRRDRAKEEVPKLRAGKTLDGRWVDWSEVLRMVRDGVTSEKIAAHFGISLEAVHDGLRYRRVRRRETPTVKQTRDLKLHDVWSRSRRKCHNQNDPNFPACGGKEIRMCPEWRTSFNAFRGWALANGYRAGLRLARKRRDRDFSPENCEWVTAREAARRSRDDEGRSARRPKPRVVVDWNEVQRLYTEDGLSAAAIARRLGAHGYTISDGLRRRGVSRPREAGPSSTLEWRRLKPAWRHMHRLCAKPPDRRQSPDARAVREWKAFEPFFEWALASGWKPGLCLARIDRRKPYGPRNCEWLTRREFAGRIRYARGPRAPRVPITAFGETKGLNAWADDPRCVVPRTTLRERLRAGMDPETAITLPTSHFPRRRRLVRAFGERKTASAWARDPRCTVSDITLRRRLRSGMPPEEAITEPPRRVTGPPVTRAITAMGATKSTRDWVRDRRCMVKEHTIRSRLRRGWTPEDAIRTPAFEEPLSHRLERRARVRAKAARA